MHKEQLEKEGNFYRRFYKGFEYFIIRVSKVRYKQSPINQFHLCGYIVLDKKSEYFISESYDDYNMEVHGGLTFSGGLDYLSIPFAIGFDCAHCWDISSDDFNFGLPEDMSYKNVDYVDKECKSIIDQLINKSHVK